MDIIKLKYIKIKVSEKGRHQLIGDKKTILNISELTIQEGEKLGIIGKNGSGKTTLLKTLSSISTPAEGNIQINTTAAPFIGHNTGFNGKLTAEDNMYLFGSLLNIPQKILHEKEQEIFEKYELEQYKKHLLQTFSSGMVMRLAVSILYQATNQTWIIDEHISAGDKDFKKSFIEKLQSMHNTQIIASHDMKLLRAVTNRTILIQDGKILKDGPTGEVIDYYYSLK